MKRLPRPKYDEKCGAYRYPVPGKRDALTWSRKRGEWFATGADSCGKWCIAKTRTDAMRGLYAMMGVEL